MTRWIGACLGTWLLMHFQAPLADTDQSVQEAIAAVEKLGGKVQRDDRAPQRPVIAVDLSVPHGNYDAEKLRCLTNFKRLRSLKLTGFCVTNAHMRIVSQLTSLEHFEAWQAEITDEGVCLLGKLSNLKELQLPICYSVTDKSLEGLKTLRRLERLGLHGTHLEGKRFNAMACSPVLKKLDLRGSGCTDQGVEALKGFVQLESLDLGSAALVTDDALQYLLTLPELREVALDGTEVTAEGAAALRKLRPGLKVYGK